jgi:hypothetical protein
MRFIEGVGLNMGQVGGHEQKVPRSGLYILLKIFSKVDPHPAAENVSGSLSFSMMVRSALFIRSGGDYPQPDFGSSGSIRGNTRLPHHAPSLDGGSGVLRPVDYVWLFGLC